MKQSDVHLNTVIDMASRSDRKILLLDKCPKSVAKRTDLGVRCAHGTTKIYDIKTVYAQSQFCLITKNERLFQLNLIEALAANCIPVIFADNVILPFTEVIIHLSLDQMTLYSTTEECWRAKKMSFHVPSTSLTINLNSPTLNSLLSDNRLVISCCSFAWDRYTVARIKVKINFIGDNGRATGPRRMALWAIFCK